MEPDTVGLAGPIDPARVEPLPAGHAAKQVEPFDALKAQVRALMDELAVRVRRGLDASQIKMRIDELLGRSAPQRKVAAVSARKSRAPLADSSALRELGGTGAQAPVQPDRRTAAGRNASGPSAKSSSVALPPGVSLSASAGTLQGDRTASRRLSEPPQPKLDESTWAEIQSLQRQADEVHASGGDVTPIKNRIIELLSQGKSTASKAQSGAGVAAEAMTTEAFSGEVVESEVVAPYDPDRDEINSLLEQRKELEIAGRDFSDIDTRLGELTHRGRETLDDNGGVTFYSSHAPRYIWHYSCVADSITVSNLGPQITDVEVQIDTLTFSYDTDLDIYLISPAGDTCTLSTDNGGTGDNYYNTRFDDDAACIIGSAGCNTAPFTGSFHPEEALSTFDGENPNGVWRLRVCSDEDNGDGYLRRWRLQIRAPLVGDSCGNAITMSVPGTYTGNTCYALDDYFYACPPYTGGQGGRDIAYRYTPPVAQQVTFSLCRSSFDTKIYVYDDSCGGTPMVCNDDVPTATCPGANSSLRSLLRCVSLQAGHTYYIVVDGYGGACGDYVLEAGICPPCTLTCLGTDTIECTENPDTSHSRLDCDGGCNNVGPGGVASYDTIQCGDTVCGLGFTYVRQGSTYRDTDWYRFTLSERSRIKATVYAEFNVSVYILNAVCPASVLYSTSGFACDTTELSVVCIDAGTYTLWVAPSDFNGIPVPLTYRVVLDCEPCPDGVDCSDPVVLSSQYVTMASQTTCWYGADYNTTCLGNYDNGEDIVYSLTLSQTGDYAFWMDPRGTSWTGFLLDDHCPPDGPGACIATYTNIGSLPYGVLSQHLTAGTYYLMMDTWAEPICIPEFDFALGRVYSCVTCQPLDRIECEETVDSTNALLDCDGGCNNAENTFGAIVCGDTVCGKAFTYVRRGSTYRDTDWYEFTLWEYDTVRVHAVGEFPLQLSLLRIDTGCSVTSLAYELVAACDTASVADTCLEPGTYAIFVAPSVFVGIPYPLDYRVWLHCGPCPPGQDCNSPIDITDAATVPAQTTLGKVNDYSNTCLINYDGGEDIIYKWTVTEEGDYKVKLNPYSTTWTGILLDDNCPPDVTGCIATHTSSAAAPHGIACRHLTAGEYYIMVDTYPSPNFIPNFDLITAPCYTCVIPQQGDVVECAEIVDTSHARLDCDGGCNVPDRTFDSIACGQTIAGRCFTYVVQGSQFRDTDWFRFDVTAPESVHVSASAEFPLQVLIVRLLNDSCTLTILYSGFAQACSTLELTTACLDTGAYVLWAGPSVFGGIPDPADYRMTMTCLPCGTPGEDCANAISISDDTTLLNQTTCGLGHDYENSCLGSFSLGEDIIYRWTVTQEADYTLWLNPHDSGWSGILLDDHCPPDTTDCIAWHISGDDFSHGIACQHLTPGTYYIMIDTWPDPDCIPEFDLSITAATVPVNDHCANAAVVMVPSTTYGTTKCATLDTIPDCPGTTEALGVWYQIVGTGNTITASLCSTATAWDSRLSLFTCGCTSLHCEASDGDYCGAAAHAQLSWCSRAGEVYWLLVYPEFNSMGDFRLDVSDDGAACTNPARCPCWDTTLTAPGQISGNTLGAGNDCAARSSEDVVVKVLIPSAGDWSFSLCGSSYDTYLYLTLDCCGDSVAWNDDLPCNNMWSGQSSLCVNLPVAGAYYALIEGFSPSLSGPFVLNVQPAGPLPVQVTGVSATSDRCDSIIVTWNDQADEQIYELVRDNTEGWILTANTIRFADVPAAGQHGYYLFAVNGCGWSSVSLTAQGNLLSPPSQVTGVAASENRCNDVLITWFDVADETGYRVLRNSVQVGTDLAANTTSYHDVTALSGTAYSYAVAAFNPGCETLSAPDSGTRVVPLGAVTGVAASDTSCTRVLVIWSNSLFPDSFQVRRNGVRLGSTPAITSFFFDETAVPGVTYTYRVVGYNACGAGDTTGSDQGTRLAVPSAVTSVSATDNRCDSVLITWSYPAGPYTFLIRRAGQSIGQVGSSTHAYTDTTCVPGVSRLYCVVAYNECGAGDTSGCDLGMCLTAPQQAPNPIVPDSCASFNICWASVPDADGYTIRRSGSVIDSVSAGTLCYSDLAAPQQHQLTVAAFNACGEGPQSPPITVGFSVLPTVSNLAASDTLCDQVSLTWSYTLRVDSFHVYRNDTLIGGSTLPAFADLTAVPYTVYSYAVYGHNVCGTGPRSAPDNGASWHVPAQVTGVNATSSRCDSVIITWQDVANETLYRIFRNGTEAGTTAADVTRFADVPAAGTFSYTVRAENWCGSGAVSAPASGTRLAVPGTPTNVTASSNLCGEIAVGWTSAGGDIDSFRVFRDLAQIASVNASTLAFTDTVSGTHSYTLRAHSSECGNSPVSTPATGTGHAGANTPTGLTFVSPAVCDSIRMTWTDGGGEVSGYVVRRDGAPIDTVTSTSFTDHGVDDTLNHGYTVAAYNPFCDTSAFTSPVSGHLRKLVALVTVLPEILPCSTDVVLQLDLCSGVEGDSIYLQLDGGAYLPVGGHTPPVSQETVPIRNSGPRQPDSRLMIVIWRDTRSDTVVSDPFTVDSCALSADEVAGAIPGDFFLDQNFPNPFNPLTTLRFGLPREANVTIEVFDVLGRRAGSVIRGFYRPGVHTVVWDCSACPTGMYLVRLQAGDRTLLRKILLMK
ncbi:MAG: proprotein convertase P-domain-containing protein [bacterium]|nr:proprotein convertase P-domain-containing protein [bacterium]